MSAPAKAEAAVERAQASAAPFIQRKCCARCAGNETDEDRPLVQRRGRGAAAGVPASVDHVLAMPGMPLPVDARAPLERSFGADLGHVRIHDDASSHRAADDLAADAFTVGSHIAFAPGQRGDLGLLAHEVAHTVQQGGVMRRAADGRIGAGDIPALEAEADGAAAAVLSGLPAPALSRIGRPHLSRKGRSFRKPKSADGLPSAVKGIEDGPTGGIAAVNLGTFKLPSEKGDVKSAYEARAAEGALEAVMQLDGTIRPALKQGRPPTSDLREIWKTRHGWSGTVDELWEKAGGDPGFRAKGAGAACHVDHVLELQLEGNNTKENMQALDPTENMDSGRWINQYLVAQATAIRDAKPKLDAVVIHFDAVSQGKALCGPCCKIDQKAATVSKKAAKAQDAEGAATEAYALSAGGMPTSVKVPPLAGKKPEPVRLVDSTIPENRSAASLIAGLRLVELNRLPQAGKGRGAKAKTDTIDAIFDKEKARLPLTLAGKSAIRMAVSGDAGALSFQDPPAAVKFVYPYLSEGAFTRLEQNANGLSAAGWIDVKRVPFLGKLDVEIGDGRMVVTKGIDPKSLKAPIPGFRVTEAALGLQLAPEFRPSGKLGFALGPAAKPILTGDVEVSGDAGVLVAAGTIRATIPGLDEASGKVTYRSDSGWEGSIQLRSTKLPRSKSASVDVGIKPGPGGAVVTADGTLVLAPFEGQEVTLGVRYADRKFVFRGHTRIKVPVKGVDPVELYFTYDGDRLEAKGTTGFTVAGLKGSLTVYYVDGDVFGDGDVSFDKGKAKGSLKGKLGRRGKFSGEGALSYQVTPSLILEGGITIDEEEHVRLKGAIVVPKPIRVFPRVPKNGGKKELLSFHKLIPIPGLSIGIAGVVASFDAGIDIHYGIGPGELRDTRLDGALNPFDPNPDPEVSFSTRFVIPADAGIGGYIRAGIGIGADIGIASASLTGGIRLNASADLDGGIELGAKGTYKAGRFTLDAEAVIQAALVLGLGMSADVTARASFFGFETEKVWEWTLAKYRLETGLEFKMVAPAHYDSAEEFKPPSLDQIKWTLPTLDPAAIVERMMSSAKRDERGG